MAVYTGNTPDVWFSERINPHHQNGLTTVVPHTTPATGAYPNGELYTAVAFPNGITTRDCYEFPPGHVPHGNYIKKSAHGKRQATYMKNGIKTRSMLWRMSFYNDPNFDDMNYTVSHLCHNIECYNPVHHVLETLPVNKGRNGCPGGLLCRHSTPCIMPGPSIQ